MTVLRCPSELSTEPQFGIFSGQKWVPWISQIKLFKGLFSGGTFNNNEFLMVFIASRFSDGGNFTIFIDSINGKARLYNLCLLAVNTDNDV